MKRIQKIVHQSNAQKHEGHITRLKSWYARVLKPVLLSDVRPSHLAVLTAVAIYAISTVLNTQTAPVVPTPVVGEQILSQTVTEDKIAGTSAVPIEREDGLSEIDPRVAQLQAYLESRNSPLAQYAPVFIENADTYDVDWKLVPAITGIESSFGIHMIPGTYNGYGWGGGTLYLGSWEESIELVTRSLRQKYIDRGADTIEKIGRIYAPPSTTWASKVTYFMNQIDGFTPKTTGDLALAL